MSIKKRIAVLLTFVLALLLLFGCTQKSESIKEAETDTELSLTFDEYSGSREKLITVEAGKTALVSVAIVCQGGDMELSITNTETGETAYTGKKLTTSSFSVTLKNAATYRLDFAAKNATGSVAIAITEPEEV